MLRNSRDPQRPGVGKKEDGSTSWKVSPSCLPCGWMEEPGGHTSESFQGLPAGLGLRQQSGGARSTEGYFLPCQPVLEGATSAATGSPRQPRSGHGTPANKGPSSIRSVLHALGGESRTAGQRGQRTTEVQHRRPGREQTGGRGGDGAGHWCLPMSVPPYMLALGGTTSAGGQGGTAIQDQGGGAQTRRTTWPVRHRLGALVPEGLSYRTRPALVRRWVVFRVVSAGRAVARGTWVRGSRASG